ncbi:MAG: hypothetical protein KTR14_09740 [Vampirovibrio sp.]|nr:hypothetical protein [Vampirovibrio sp.]
MGTVNPSTLSHQPAYSMQNTGQASVNHAQSPAFSTFQSAPPVPGFSEDTLASFIMSGSASHQPPSTMAFGTQPPIVVQTLTPPAATPQPPAFQVNEFSFSHPLFLKFMQNKFKEFAGDKNYLVKADIAEAAKAFDEFTAYQPELATALGLKRFNRSMTQLKRDAEVFLKDYAYDQSFSKKELDTALAEYAAETGSEVILEERGDGSIKIAYEEYGEAADRETSIFSNEFLEFYKNGFNTSFYGTQQGLKKAVSAWNDQGKEYIDYDYKSAAFINDHQRLALAFDNQNGNPLIQLQDLESEIVQANLYPRQPDKHY